MRMYLKLAPVGIVFAILLQFLANCVPPNAKNVNKLQPKQLLLPQFMVRHIGHGQEIVAVEHYPVEHDEVNAEGANAVNVKLPTRSNEFMRPCYFSPIQCLLRSPAQRRSFETQQRMINNKLFRDGKPFMKLANNDDSSSMDEGNANFGQQKARQRIERQIAMWKVGKTKQNELELSKTQETDTFRRHLFSNLWRN